MPELPEVETVVRGLRASLPGRFIREVRLGKTDFIDDPIALAESLPGCRIAGVTRLGKFICIGLNRENSVASIGECLYLIVHLGMTGQLTVRHPGDRVMAHTHCFFGLDNN